MKKFLKFSIIGFVAISLLAVVIYYLRLKDTKSLSPEDEVVFNQKDLTIKVFYNRPYKKGRQIFGQLVPFDEVWRTGANEATTFETNKDLSFSGKILKAGKYTLWTKPGPETWTIYFNKEYGQWGINADGRANRNPQEDALSFDVHALQQEHEIEQFTIAFENAGEDSEMVLMWDKTLVPVPFTY